MSLKIKAASGIKWNAGFSVFSTVLQTVKLIVLARLLSPEAFGLMAMVSIVVGFAQAYSDVGISAAIIHRQDATRDQLSSLYWLNVLAGVAIFLIVFLLSPVISWFLGDARLSLLIRVTAATFLIIPWGKQFEILLQRDLRFLEVVWIQGVALTISTVTTILVAYWGFGVWALVWGQISLALVATVLFVWNGSREFMPQLHFRRLDLKGYISFGLYQMGERGINLISGRLDQLLIGRMLGAQELGYYSFAFNLVTLPLIRINPIITKVAFPVFAKLQENSNRMQHGYMKVVKLLSTVNAPLLLGLVIISPTAIPLVFGEQWLNSIVFVQLLSLTALSRTIGNPVGSLLLAKGRPDLGFHFNLLVLLISIPFIFVGARLGGAPGMAAALLLLQILLQFPAYFYLIRPMIGQCGLTYTKVILKPVLLATGMGILVWVVAFVGATGWVGLMAQVLLGGVSYLALMWLFDRHQVDELREVFLSR